MLKLRDFLKAEIKADSIEFEKVPTILVVRRSLSKTRNQYFAFIPEQTTNLFREYLELSPKILFLPRGPGL